MRMSSDDRSNFPELTQYVRVSLPQVTNVPAIVQNMKKHGSLSAIQLQNALLWGTNPKIVVTDLSSVPAPDGSGLVSANGRFDPAKPDQIELDIGRAQDFEDDAYGAGSDTTAGGRKVFIVGTTLLHELCHWGNFHKGRTEVEEEGIGFEEDVYGRNTG
jgi:hypothetical protein